MPFMGFSRQEYWSGLSFCPPVNHTLSELTTMTHPSWVALSGMAHSFTELLKLFHHDKAMIHEGASTDWFKIGKGVRQGCILSSYLFNFYTEYIM